MQFNSFPEYLEERYTALKKQVCGKTIRILFILLSLFVFTGNVQATDNEPNIPDSITVEHIIIECHRRTKDRIIFRELALKEGDRFHRDDIDKVLKTESNKVYNTNLFNTVKIFYHEYTPGKADVVVSVEEMWYFWPVPILELGDRNFNQWWTQSNRSLDRIDYGLRFRQRNFRGRNEDLKLVLQLGFTRKMELIYRVPYVNKRQTLGLNFKLLYAENRNIPFRTYNNILEFHRAEDNRLMLKRYEAQASVVFRGSFYNRHHFFTSYTHNVVDDTIAVLNPNYFLGRNTEQQFLTLQYTFSRDLRDRAAYPLSGFYLEGSIRQNGFGLLSDDFFQTTIRFEGSKFFDMGKNFYFAGSFAGLYSLQNVQPYYNLHAMGFAPYLIRGFELNVAEGQRMAFYRNTLRMKFFEHEIRFPLIPSQFNSMPIAVFPKLYLDAGYVQNTNRFFETNTLSNQTLWGGGFGLDVVTYYNLVARFEYSFNSLGARGLFFDLKSEF